MIKSISYNLTLEFDTPIDSTIQAEIKKQNVELFNNIETGEDAIVLTNDNESLVITNDLLLVRMQGLLFNEDLPDFFDKVISHLHSKDISILTTAKMETLVRIEDITKSDFSLIGFNPNFNNELEDTIDKDVNAIGLKFSLDDPEWHYEIEILPSDDIFILKQNCFYNIEEYEEGSEFYLELNELRSHLNNQKEFLVNKFAKLFLKFD